jgi:uncharacterized membrane protein YfcA
MLQDLILLMAGIVVGGMNAIAGGGTLIGFPVLIAAGLSPLVANATCHVTVLPGTLSSAFAYRNRLRKIPKRFLWLIVPCLIGASLGAYLLRLTNSSSFEKIVPLLITFAVILFVFQPLLHFQLHKHMIKGNYKKRGYLPILIFSLLILPVAIYGGYFGAGFGFIMLAFLGFTSLKDVHQMNAVKNLASSCMSVASIICLLGAHIIHWRYGLIMAGGNMLGGYFGAVGAQKVSSHAIRFFVISIGLGTAAYLILRSY